MSVGVRAVVRDGKERMEVALRVPLAVFGVQEVGHAGDVVELALETL